MAWVSLDDGMPDHPKNASLSDAAFRLHIAGICYCNRQLTDGLIEASEIPRLVRKFRRAGLDELVTKGLWSAVTVAGVVTLYELHDYLDWNPSREKVLARRAKAKARKDAWKEAHGHV